MLPIAGMHTERKAELDRTGMSPRSGCRICLYLLNQGGPLCGPLAGVSAGLCAGAPAQRTPGLRSRPPQIKDSPTGALLVMPGMPARSRAMDTRGTFPHGSLNRL
jgi:hypothetical protein